MDVPLQHLVGTVALIGLVAAVGISYQAVASYIEANVYKTQLGQIAENVALNLVEVATLTEFSATKLQNQTLIKTVNLPLSLNEKAYLVRLISVDEGSLGRRQYVQVELVTRSDIYARALIPLPSNYTNIVFKVEGLSNDILGPVGVLQVKRGEGGVVLYSGKVYGGVPNFVVWSYEYNTTLIYVGIGRWVPPGGP